MCFVGFKIHRLNWWIRCIKMVDKVEKNGGEGGEGYWIRWRRMVVKADEMHKDGG